MQDNKHALLAHIVGILTVGVWGTTFVSTKTLLFAGLDPADIFFYRFLLAYICTLTFFHKRLFADTLRDELTMMLVGVCGGSLYFLTENYALVFAQASDVSIIVCSCPILTSLLFMIFRSKERMTPLQNAGLLISFLGIVFIVMNGQLMLHVTLSGYILAFCAALCWAFYSLFSRLIIDKYSTWFINRKVFFYGLLTIIPYYLFVKPLNTDMAILLQPMVITNLLFLGLLASMVCFVTWMWVMRKIGTVHSTAYIYLNPLFTIITAVIILHERITWMAIAGTIILIIGMFLSEKKPATPERRGNELYEYKLAGRKEAENKE